MTYDNTALARHRPENRAAARKPPSGVAVGDEKWGATIRL
jgi:hypothetical protein